MIRSYPKILYTKKESLNEVGFGRWQDQLEAHGLAKEKVLNCIRQRIESKIRNPEHPALPAEYVFDIPNRKQPDLFRRTVGQIRNATGIDFRFHLLRHYFTTALLEKGVDFVTIDSLLGHSKITTSLIYSPTDRERQRKALELLEG
jgi:site-specific recombinase XerD